MDTPRVIQQIQQVVAPAVMVSSCALLLLGFQNKFSNLASRFRALNHEKRTLAQKASRDPIEEARLNNISQQVDQLAMRAHHVKSAILLAYAGILCFVSTSILIFVNGYASFRLDHLTIGVFLLGFIFLLMGSAQMMLETQLFYKVISLEKEA